MPWGFGGTWIINGPELGGSISCYGPSDEDPDSNYSMDVWVDWAISEEKTTPFKAGEVVQLNPAPDIAPVKNPTVIFTKP